MWGNSSNKNAPFGFNSNANSSSSAPGAVRRSFGGRCGGFGTVPRNEDESRPTTIVKAVEEGDIGTVRRLLKSGTDPNTAGRNGALLLHIAAENSEDNVALVELLIEAGAAVNALAPRASAMVVRVTDVDHVSALMVASRCSNKGVVEALLKHGADVNMASSKGFNTALMLAAPREFDSAAAALHVVELLLQHGAKTNLVAKVSGRTALIEAAGKIADETLDIIKLLVEHDANVNTQDLAMPPGFGAKRGGKGFSPLMAAVPHGNYELIQFLLQNGAHANAMHDYQGSALTIVAGCNVLVPGNHIKTGELLLAFGADIDATNHNEMTPLMLAISNHHLLAEFLIQHGPDPNLRDKHGCTALFYALEYDRFDMMTTLVGELGATVNTWGNPTYSQGGDLFGGRAETAPCTPIIHAARKAKDHMVKALLQLNVIETCKMWL